MILKSLLLLMARLMRGVQVNFSICYKGGFMGGREEECRVNFNKVSVKIHEFSVLIWIVQIDDMKIIKNYTFTQKGLHPVMTDVKGILGPFRKRILNPNGNS
ncbi:hypothetical protein F5148DRAFT_891110 [Russula earlei]|uniref:Uncharacterized protein n=1 Tax=Russula earlei TaxID=71964 RepID=A0ACC0UBP7_9AGAM|nr:hypothetical protein F5148DRAFT_891110 [Russula earlei]